MSLSDKNRELLQRKFGRALPAGNAKVSLTIFALGKLLDAARAEARPGMADPNIQAVLDSVFGKAR